MPETTHATVRLIAPQGYGSIVPLDRTRHAGYGLRGDSSEDWSAQLNAVPLSIAEFLKAGLEYPIAFIREARDEFLPVAVLGLRKMQNLYVREGRWQPRLYRPAYIRRYPFCIVPVPTGTPGAAPQPMVCVQEDQLAKDSPQPLFNRNGEPTQAWASIQGLLEAVEGARQQTRVLCRRLEALELLVPFEAVATQRGRHSLRLSGLHRIDEARLNKLSDRDLHTMMGKGELRAIYAQMNSLENFRHLLDLSQQLESA